MDLASVRKMAEENALIRMRQQMEHQKQMNQMNLNVQQFERTIVMNSRRFRWRSQDVWSKFLDEKFHYSRMNSELLHQDAQWLQSLRDKIFPTISPTPYSLLVVNQQQASPKESNSQQVIHAMIREHLYQIVRKPGHALYHLLDEFVQIFMQKYSVTSAYSVAMMGSESNGHHIMKEDISKAMSDIETFIEKLVQALFGKYWTETMNDLCEKVNDCDKVVVSCLYHAILTMNGGHGSGAGSVGGAKLSSTNSIVYHRILQMYYVLNRENDDLLNMKMEEMTHGGRPLLLKHFGVKRDFLLSHDDSANGGHGNGVTSSSSSNGFIDPYQPAIDLFIRFNLESNVPLEKLYCLRDCITEITNCVNRYYASQKSDNGSEVNAMSLELGADDLLPLFSYVMVKAQPSFLFSKFNFVVDFVDQSLLLGELGYSLATLETAMTYMLSCDLATNQQQQR